MISSQHFNPKQQNTHIIFCHVKCTHVFEHIIHGIIIPTIISMVCNHYTHVQCTSLFFPQKFGQKKVYIIQGKMQYLPTAHGMFSRIDHVLGHKTSLNKFKKTEIISNIFSDHNSLKLEINHKKNTEKYTKTWKLNICYWTMNGSTMRSRKRSKDTWKNENKNTTIQNFGAQEQQS